ncbi:lipoxygenase [Anabaena cylindrica FACHB-243]|uniref:Arachidonate 15-lipoxygenase n=1 Tax=Anabaena cylindrica (strain ATCC 27899 / PCC 7122) TaxID=272123 RepID=K9ZQD3_ANACC|nr:MULTISPECIES: lipoxygenase family protein [Anabaena]AFZ60570.1 Arachidonate 15-lipoxygenase [Anabaena cylindrica PCC 7122]MBD2418299.1 lipoxygenase [Anabaena cylindrica FACHB-243]MBY5284255.1 lipoxygenase [Anabaena sp. CCAP 1446/1C]MBY5307896.1 lipoxygenase [Anabaena sp. CCAP 1446/1C]MCM2408818.1 lipoxygenase [Anabaena sp. CCAP 1446/1C]
MTKYTSLTEQKGYYRYHPNGLEQKGYARLFPYVGEDGAIRYILTKLYQNLLEQGKLSQPWTLLLTQLENKIADLDESWVNISTLLVDCKVFQSGWFNFDLPPNEQFNNSYIRERKKLVERLLAANKAVEAVDKNLPPLKRNAEQRKLFFQALAKYGVKPPIMSMIHERDGGLSDREFVRQRVAGANPTVLRRVQTNDQNFLQALATQPYKLANNGTIDLIKSASENRLFIADYPLLRNLKVTDLQPGKYVGSPTALFYRTDKGLEPILIEVQKGRVITPGITGEAADDWMKAKLYFQTADATHHELIAHLSYTHLAMEALAIATPRQLASNHPVYQLLSPHFQFLIAINNRGNNVLLAAGSAIENLMAPTLEASSKLMNQAYREKSFWYYSLLNDIEVRGIEPKLLPDFPYRDDALLLWEAIAKYTTRYLQRYYPDDKAVQQDPYLQAWADELSAPLNTRPKSDFPQAPAWFPKELVTESGIEPQELPSYPRVPGFTKIGSLQQLIDIATITIFTCGPQHAAVNFSQFDYFGYVPNAPFANYNRPDTPTSLEEFLPSTDKDLEQMRLTSALSGIFWGKLGSSNLIQFADKIDKQILAQFQTDLLEIEAKIKARNQQRLTESGVEYSYLLPSRIPNSINI